MLQKHTHTRVVITCKQTLDNASSDLFNKIRCDAYLQILGRWGLETNNMSVFPLDLLNWLENAI